MKGNPFHRGLAKKAEQLVAPDFVESTLRSILTTLIELMIYFILQPFQMAEVKPVIKGEAIIHEVPHFYEIVCWIYDRNFQENEHIILCYSGIH